MRFPARRKLSSAGREESPSPSVHGGERSPPRKGWESGRWGCETSELRRLPRRLARVSGRQARRWARGRRWAAAPTREGPRREVSRASPAPPGTTQATDGRRSHPGRATSEDGSAAGGGHPLTPTGREADHPGAGGSRGARRAASA